MARFGFRPDWLIFIIWNTFHNGTCFVTVFERRSVVKRFKKEKKKKKKTEKKKEKKENGEDGNSAKVSISERIAAVFFFRSFYLSDFLSLLTKN